MSKYGTREEYWAARGRMDLVRAVSRETAESLRKKGIEPDPESREYKKEFNRLAAAFHRRKADMIKERRQRESAWLEKHERDSDGQLVTYLREAVKEEAQLKKPCSVAGGMYIARRLGGWQKALRLAGLLPPEETQPEDQAQSPPEEQ